MLGAHVSVIESFGFFRGESQNFFDTRCIRNISDHLLIGTGADLFLDFHANGFEVEAELLQDVDGDSLAQLDQTEQQMLGPHKIVVEAVGLFASKRENLLGAGCKIIHRFVTHTSKCNHFSSLSNPAAGGARGLATGRLTGFNRSRTMSARSKSRSSADSFSECCFCRCAGCVRMNNSSTKERSTPGKRPTSTPNFINESRFIVSFDEML